MTATSAALRPPETGNPTPSFSPDASVDGPNRLQGHAAYLRDAGNRYGYFVTASSQPPNRGRIVRPVSGAPFLSFLGPNTVPIVRELGDRLTAEIGIDLAGELAPTWRDFIAAVDTGTAHVVWLCGLATIELVDSGRFDAEIVAAPVFPGESRAVYRSVVVARPEIRAATLDDLEGTRLAINGTGSWSGYHALRVHLAEAGRFDPFFGSVTETGSHRASIDCRRGRRRRLCGHRLVRLGRSKSPVMSERGSCRS